MGKVSIKKNVKPKKVAPKKKITPKKVAPNKKEGQTQTQSLTVNIGSNITKKRARTSPQKKQIAPKAYTPSAIYPSSVISLNQPNIKYPNPLVSAIAQQEKPKVIIDEVNLIKAIEEQNKQPEIEENKVNDLEKVRSTRVKKFEVKPSEATVALKGIIEDQPIKHALLGQLRAEQQDDTEEIAQLIPAPTRQKIEFISSSTQTFSPNISSGPLSNLPPIISKKELLLLRPKQEADLFGLLKEAETFEYNAPSNKSLLSSLQDKYDTQQQILFGRLQAEQSLSQAEEPLIEPEEITVDPQVVAQQENILQQIQERGAAELIAERPSEPTPLSQPTVELGFGGLSEEPIQTSVGQILPPEPISQGALEVKETKKLPKTILEPLIKPPSILQGQAAAEPIISAEPSKKSSRDQFSNMNNIDIVKYLNTENDNVYTLKNEYDVDGNEIQVIYKNGKAVNPSINILKSYARKKVKESTKVEEPIILEERQGIEL
jgi:hypothetical protein